MRMRASALASSVWGRWRFISSPSKSALKGLQQHSLKRNVLFGITLACGRTQQMSTMKNAGRGHTSGNFFFCKYKNFQVPYTFHIHCCATLVLFYANICKSLKVSETPSWKQRLGWNHSLCIISSQYSIKSRFTMAMCCAFHWVCQRNLTIISACKMGTRQHESQQLQLWRPWLLVNKKCKCSQRSNLL